MQLISLSSRKAPFSLPL